MRRAFRQLNWRYALGELTLIVVGILIALAIDSSASRRAAEDDAESYLRDLVIELRADSAGFSRRTELLGDQVRSASLVLEAVRTGASDGQVADALLRSVFGEGTTSEAVVWEELQTTGNLRLIEDVTIRRAIMSHYLAREARMRSIEDNFLPAVRDLRALAWDVLPIPAFQAYFTTSESGVADVEVLPRLSARDDAVFLLKRVILTSTVARVNLESVIESGSALLNTLSGR